MEVSRVGAVRFSQGNPLKVRSGHWWETAEEVVSEALRRKPSWQALRAAFERYARRLRTAVLLKSARPGASSLLVHRCNGWTFLAARALSPRSPVTWHLRFDLFYLFALMEIELKLRGVLAQYADAAAAALLVHVLRCQLNMANRVLGARGVVPARLRPESRIEQLCYRLEALVADSCRAWTEI